MSENKRKAVKKDDMKMKREIARITYAKSKEYRDKYGEIMPKEEKRKIRRQARKHVRRKRRITKIVGFFAISAVTLGGPTYLLNSGDEAQKLEEAKENDAKIDNLEDEQAINEIAQTAAEKFRSELQDFSMYMSYETQIRKEVKEKISSLKTEEEVLAYLKELGAEKLNETNSEKVDPENMTILKSKPEEVGELLYLDTAENGDKIFRIDRKTIVKENGYKQLFACNQERLIMTAKLENGYIRETAAYYQDGKYIPVYNANEEVKEQGTNVLCTLGDVMDKGIRFKAVIEADKGLNTDKWEREQNFINAVTKYKLENLKETRNLETSEKSEATLENVQDDGR